MKKTTLTAAILIAGTTVAALAHGGATGIVKERMEAMMAMGKAVKSVAPMMRGETAYDAEALRDAARTFQAHSGKALTEQFPKGSGGAPSETKDEVWQDWDRFTELADQLGIYARGLELAAANGLGKHGGMGAGAMMGGSSMMGGGSMMGGTDGMMSAEDIGAMPADAAFNMTTQVCSACHARFRAEDD
ncbi:cytochrome c-556 (plasmid) [Antarctobacter heliothermus]|uniref:Cytochrome c-556 n=1 Tax=Antarctobacter heliothermus TaxID=74033 RepID=A0A222EB62_9RHOB|nr:cytochrome c [Antarctobacter heliothermus]ASP23434.1 cytochrome c-556 [Antarctobacter heliothermus]MBT52198.1 cytochrome C [Mameliella sp.]|tara:strand:+ start:2201 stop:2767 length:567 start_codon:yes stop_codon:yes gene_type:complete